MSGLFHLQRRILQCSLLRLQLKHNLCAYGFLVPMSWAGEEKQPYIQQAQVDKKRYEKESAVYRGEAPVDVDSGNESD